MRRSLPHWRRSLQGEKSLYYIHNEQLGEAVFQSAYLPVQDGNGKSLFGVLLADDVIVQNLHDFDGFGQIEGFLGFMRVVGIDYLLAELDAVGADIDPGAGDYALDHILRFAAEGAFDC